MQGWCSQDPLIKIPAFALEWIRQTMARSSFNKWLAPDAMQPDGSLWIWDIPDTDRPASTLDKARTSPCPKVNLRRRTLQRDPFTADERVFLRTRLGSVQRQAGGLAAGIRLRRVYVRNTPQKVLSAALRSLLNRGFVEPVIGQSAPSRLYFTAKGTSGLKAFFSRQPRDFAVLFPRIHHELGLHDSIIPSFRYSNSGGEYAHV